MAKLSRFLKLLIIFLYKNNIYDELSREVTNQHKTSLILALSIFEKTVMFDYQDFFKYIILWENTNKGIEFWYEIDLKWRNYLKQINERSID